MGLVNYKIPRSPSFHLLFPVTKTIQRRSTEFYDTPKHTKNIRAQKLEKSQVIFLFVLCLFALLLLFFRFFLSEKKIKFPKHSIVRIPMGVRMRE